MPGAEHYRVAEGDPLSVAALFIPTWNLRAYLSGRFGNVEFCAFADNLEFVRNNTPSLATAYQVCKGRKFC